MDVVEEADADADADAAAEEEEVDALLFAVEAAAAKFNEDVEGDTPPSSGADDDDDDDDDDEEEEELLSVELERDREALAVGEEGGVNTMR